MIKFNGIPTYTTAETSKGVRGATIGKHKSKPLGTLPKRNGNCIVGLQNENKSGNKRKNETKDC